MLATRSFRDERGIALLTTLLVVIAVGAITLAAVMMTLNANLVTKNGERISGLDAAAIAGLEEARSRLNANKALYPTTGFTTLESNATVKDASNTAIPKITRSTYLGPTGIASGQFGVVGSIVSVARDSFGNTAVRRLEVNQESFSKFAYFTDFETDTTGSTIVFGGGDQIRGPVHSNDLIRIGSSPSPAVTFFDQVTTAKSSINNQSNGSFGRPPILNATRIPMPTVADLNKLDSLAQLGSTSFAGSTAGDAGEARTRIHFLTINLGPTYGVQGFFMVYQAGGALANPEDYVSASLPTTTSTSGSYLEVSRNCGDYDGTGHFMPAFFHDTTTDVNHKHGINGTTNANKISRRDFSLSQGGASRCLLGGDSALTIPAIATGGNAAWPNTGHQDGGSWVQAPGAIQAALGALDSIAGRRDRNYLFPLNRQWNSNFKGVISVQGKVVVDGVVHGRMTIAATGDIIFVDDVTYYQGSNRDCTYGDIAGYFSGQSIIVANNTLNAPQTLNTDGSHLTSPSGTYRSYKTSTDETIYGFFLTLKTFGAEENSLGASNVEKCLIGGTFNAGRGCLVTFGGIIQSKRGAVGLTSGQGYIKRYQYDSCGATDPPPYYPTTGVFVKNRFYELDPVHFNVANWYAANQN